MRFYRSLGLTCQIMKSRQIEGLRISNPAKADLEEIIAGFEYESTKERFVDGVEHVFASVKLFPEAHRPRKRLQGMRLVNLAFYGHGNRHLGYHLVYDYNKTTGTIEILAVVHGSAWSLLFDRIRR